MLLFSLSKKIQCRRGMGYAKIYEEIKRGKCPEPRKRKKKSETRGKNRQVSGVELGGTKMPTWAEKMDKCPTVELGVFTTHLKKKREKKKIAHVLPKQRARGGEIAIWGAMRSKFYYYLYFYHYYHLLHHTCTSLFNYMLSSFGSMARLDNICMSCFSHLWAPHKHSLIYR